MSYSIEEARNLLRLACVTFDGDEDDDPAVNEKLKQTLNMNDVWGWGTAYGEYIPDEELPEVAGLFCSYGFCGLAYWVSERNGGMMSEFHDINRAIEFVRHEESLRKDETKG